MPFRIRDGRVTTVTVPLRETFATALGRKDATTNAVIELRLGGGWRGRGEASTSVVHKEQTAPALARALKRLLARHRGDDARRALPLSRALWREAEFPAAAAAFECAALEALCAGFGVPPWLWFGGARDSLETDCTLSAGSAEDAERAARRAAAAGFRRLKVKVGAGGPAADLARALAADRAGRRGGRRPLLLLDGNQRLGYAGTLRLVDACLRAGLRVALVEQPLPRAALRETARLSRRCPVPIALDEGVRDAADALRALDCDAARIWNLKVAKSGIAGCLELIALARAAGVKLMIGCMQETARGLAPSVHLACGTGAFAHADLDSDWLLDDSQPKGGFHREGALLKV